MPLEGLAAAGLAPRALAAARRALDPALGGPVPTTTPPPLVTQETKHSLDGEGAEASTDEADEPVVPGIGSGLLGRVHEY